MAATSTLKGVATAPEVDRRRHGRYILHYAPVSTRATQDRDWAYSTDDGSISVGREGSDQTNRTRYPSPNRRLGSPDRGRYRHTHPSPSRRPRYRSRDGESHKDRLSHRTRYMSASRERSAQRGGDAESLQGDTEDRRARHRRPVPRRTVSDDHQTRQSHSRRSAHEREGGGSQRRESRSVVESRRGRQSRSRFSLSSWLQRLGLYDDDDDDGNDHSHGHRRRSQEDRHVRGREDHRWEEPERTSSTRSDTWSRRAAYSLPRDDWEKDDNRYGPERRQRRSRNGSPFPGRSSSRYASPDEFSRISRSPPPRRRAPSPFPESAVVKHDHFRDPDEHEHEHEHEDRRHPRRQPSRARSLPGHGSSSQRAQQRRGSSKTPSSSSSSSAWEDAARNALRAGTMAALSSHGAPGNWLGSKGTRVATAALGAALVDTYMGHKHPQNVNGVRHTAMRQAAEYAINSIVAAPMMQRAAKRRTRR